MKRFPLVAILLLLLSLACSLTDLDGRGASPTEPLPTPHPQSERRCGDGVCDGPENPENCPQDCASGGAAAGRETPSGEAEPTEEATVAGEPVLGAVASSARLTRTPGDGSCGIEPWRPEACTLGVTWWGLQLSASAHTKVLVIPDGEDRWVITNHPDVVSRYGYDPADFRPSTRYREAAIEFVLPECEGTISVEDDFNFQVMGTYEDGQIELILSADPQEHIEGHCGVAGFAYDLNNLLYGWAVALSGDPFDLTGTLTEADLTAAGEYRREYVVDTNPSPENRDHVTATLEFMCMEKEREGVYRPIACPWKR